eukprot:PhM_4_TR10323/c0_g1_i1/m.20015/K12948/SPCS3, SPC3; signal peptidase complex subunit 3
MHNALSRANTAGTMTLTTLGVVALGLALSTYVIFAVQPPTPYVDVSATVEKVSQLKLSPYHPPFDHALLQLTLNADLRSYWHWNVKQIFVYLVASYTTPRHAFNEVVVWDYIAKTPEESVFNVTRPGKYPIEDRGTGLRGQDVTLTLRWSVMPYSGVSITGTNTHEKRAVAVVHVPK